MTVCVKWTEVTVSTHLTSHEVRCLCKPLGQMDEKSASPNSLHSRGAFGPYFVRMLLRCDDAFLQKLNIKEFPLIYEKLARTEFLWTFLLVDNDVKYLDAYNIKLTLSCSTPFHD